MKQTFFKSSFLILLLSAPLAAFTQAPVNHVQKTAPTLHATASPDPQVTTTQPEARQEVSPSVEAPAPLHPPVVQPAAPEDRKQTAPVLPAKDE